MNSTKLAANLPETAWVLAIIFSTISGIGGCSSEEGRVNVSENFDGNSFDRTVWQMARPAPEDGTVEIKDDAMVFTIAAGGQAPTPDSHDGKICIHRQLRGNDRLFAADAAAGAGQRIRQRRTGCVRRRIRFAPESRESSRIWKRCRRLFLPSWNR